MGLIVALFLTVAAQQDSRPYQPQQGPGAGGNNRAEKIEALKIAFITQQLNLTPEEAQKFWPIYNTYKEELAALRKSYGLDNRGVEPSAEQKLDFEQKKLDLNKKYLPQVEAAIGKEKAAILYSLDEKFRQKLKELQQQRQQQRSRQWNNGGY